jgi:hypothetical protein
MVLPPGRPVKAATPTAAGAEVQAPRRLPLLPHGVVAA